jgi:hypothetical protein
MFGIGWSRFKIAHMSTGEKIGVKWLILKNNETPKDFECWKTSACHFCVQDPDIKGLVAKILEPGGKPRMPLREYHPGEKLYGMCYVKDPFGLVFEVYSVYVMVLCMNTYFLCSEVKFKIREAI